MDMMGGGMDTGGNDSSMGHKEMYHTLLNMHPAHWEAIREAAHQMMGGTPSKMWHDEHGMPLSAGPAEADGGGYGLEDLRDIVLTPTPQAAGRLIELEHDAGGGSFLKSIKSAAKSASKHIASVGKYVNKGLKIGKNVADVASDLGGPIGEYGKTASNILGKAQDIKDKYEPLAHKAADTVGHVADAASNPRGALTNVVNVLKDPEQLKSAVNQGKDVYDTLKSNSDLHDKISKTLDAASNAAKNISRGNDNNNDETEQKIMEAPGNPAPADSGAGLPTKKKRKGGKISKAQIGKMQAGKKEKKRKNTSYGGMKEDMPKPEGSGMEIAGGMPIAGGMRIGGKICRDPRKRF